MTSGKLIVFSTIEKHPNIPQHLSFLYIQNLIVMNFYFVEIPHNIEQGVRSDKRKP